MLTSRTLFVCVGILILTLPLVILAGEPDYDSSKVTVRFDQSLTKLSKDSILSSFARIECVLDDPFVYDGFIACSLSSGNNYKDFLDSLYEVDDIQLVEPYYVSSSGQPWLIGEGFCVGLQNGVTADSLAAFNAGLGVVISRQPMTNVVVIKNTDSSGSRLWELVDIFDTLPDVRYAQPNYQANITLCAYKTFDYFNELQWQLIKVIGDFDSASVWDFAGMQRPVTVAVVDDGIDVHDDLPANRILSGYDFADDDDTTLPARRAAHGMACAGLIAASHCYDSMQGLFAPTGITSMDPQVTILPVKIFCDDPWIGCSVPDDSIAAAIMYAWQQGADILSCSWSYRIDLGGSPDVDRQVVNDALDSAYEFGRGGLGCPLIFAAGNKGVSRRAVSYPARYEKCFAVGAIDMYDVRYPWSGYGPDWYGDTSVVVLDLVAPSGGKGIWYADDTIYGDVWTLDQMDTLGLNNGGNYREDDVDWDCEKPGSGIHNNMNYNCKAGGTSMAVPLVSGTAALLLSRDSTLTVEMVYTILRESAVRLSDSMWLYEVPDTALGYGRVDAFRAVLSISHGNVDNSISLLIDISDLVYIIDYMFKGGPPPFPSILLADVDCDGGVIDIEDLNYLVDYMFTGGPPIVDTCFVFE